MLYYADRERDANVSKELATIACTIDSCAAQLDSPARQSLTSLHSALVGAAIALGELHQAVADRSCPYEDDVSQEAEAFTRAGVLLGQSAYRTHCAIAQPQSHLVVLPHLRTLLHAARSAISDLAGIRLPASLAVRIPEGYAFYSLYPEMYFASLKRLTAEISPAEGYFVIGIRSIGTSLACFVAGALLEEGHQVHVETLRPRGDPFNRKVRVDPGIRERIKRANGMTFVIVDEGPGLTCSSFLSVAAALDDTGVPESRIAVLSAWGGMPSIYASDEIRSRWPRQRVYFTDASDAFDGWRAILPLVEDAVASSSPSWNGETSRDWAIKDISYGRWREICYPSPEHWPVVHRPAERTKLLLSYDDQNERSPENSTPRHEDTKTSRLSARRDLVSSCLGGFQTGSRLLAKFVGLGEYGRMKYQRATVLADEGFGPPVAGYAYGFLLYQFLDGRPLEASDLSPAVMYRLAAYYAFIDRTFRESPEPRFDRLSELILFNSHAAIDVDGSWFVEGWRKQRDEIDALPLVGLDGRPFPHEWLAVPGQTEPAYIKADSADHALDHTMVGEQSILWDLASACEEWEMDDGQRRSFLRTWERASRDSSSARFLDFFRVAYLAFRTAELHYAVHSTNEDVVRMALKDQQFKINERLRCALQHLPA